jgi:hypothetical protein
MTLFKFVTTYVGFLKAIPLLPHAFDALMRLFSFCFKREITDAMDHIEEELAEETGVTLSIHKYGGRQFNYNNRELGHIHGNGMVDVLLNKKIKEELMHKGWVEKHHTFKNSGWITMFLRSRSDAEKAIHVLKISKNRIDGWK